MLFKSGQYIFFPYIAYRTDHYKLQVMLFSLKFTSLSWISLLGNEKKNLPRVSWTTSQSCCSDKMHIIIDTGIGVDIVYVKPIAILAASVRQLTG